MRKQVAREILFHFGFRATSNDAEVLPQVVFGNPIWYKGSNWGWLHARQVT